MEAYKISSTCTVSIHEGKGAAQTQDASLQILFAKQGIGLAPLSEVSNEDLIKDGLLQKKEILKGVHEKIWLISPQVKLNCCKTDKDLHTLLKFDLYQLPG